MLHLPEWFGWVGIKQKEFPMRDDFAEFVQAFNEMTCTPNRKNRRVQTGSNMISSGLPTGTVCEGDTDASGSPGADGAPAAASDDDGGDPDPEPARPRSCNTPPTATAPPPSGPKTRRNATATDGEPSPSSNDPTALWRLPDVLKHVPLSRSTWLAGVKSGRYPQPVRLSNRRVVWRAADIRAFLESL